ncbi:type II secretion system protein [Cupriavidus sp. SIMBA_020]|uniref:type II secretion system protein n=1 Tax=Cupriavidus sp. SIMBA_020 TaxID=3085766 RepID=UPI00397BFE18
MCPSLRQPVGFTLLELLVSLAILAILAMLVLPITQLEVQRMREKDLRLALREIRIGIDAYKQAYDTGRMLRSIGNSGYPATLETLVDGVEDVRDPDKHKIYFMRRIPRDPMVRDPALSDAETWGKRSYDSEPDAPAEGRDVFDIYSRSSTLGLNGIPYNRW